MSGGRRAYDIFDRFQLFIGKCVEKCGLNEQKHSYRSVSFFFCRW